MSVSNGTIRAVLFDKDGTLIDFHASWVGAGLVAARELCSLAEQPQRFHALIADAGYDLASERLDPQSRWAAGTTESLVRHWISELGIGELVAGEEGSEHLVARMGELMSAEAGRQIIPLADLGALFAQLSGHGLRLGVATMDLEANARMALQRLGVHEVLDFVCGCDSGHGIKPGPGMVLAFCASCGLEPRQIMVVGDTPHDMNMARAAGAGAAVAVTSGTGQASDLCALADHVVDDLVELLAVLRELPAAEDVAGGNLPADDAAVLPRE